MTLTLDRFRIALKFSLWTWALYWPGGGLLLLLGGLDPISILITLGSLTCFILLLATGALKADSSRTLKEFFVERPLYLVGGLVVAIFLAAVVPVIEGVALLLFAAFWFGGLIVAGTRLVQHVRSEGRTIYRSRADQLLIVFALTGVFSSFVFLDALLPLLFNGLPLGTPATVVAISSWMNLLYPVLVLIAAVPFRDPLNWRFMSRKKANPVAAKRRKSSKTPLPFRAS